MINFRTLFPTEKMLWKMYIIYLYFFLLFIANRAENCNSLIYQFQWAVFVVVVVIVVVVFPRQNTSKNWLWMTMRAQNMFSHLYYFPNDRHIINFSSLNRAAKKYINITFHHGISQWFGLQAQRKLLCILLLFFATEKIEYMKNWNIDRKKNGIINDVIEMKFRKRLWCRKGEHLYESLSRTHHPKHKSQ